MNSFIPPTVFESADIDGLPPPKFKKNRMVVCVSLAHIPVVALGVHEEYSLCWALCDIRFSHVLFRLSPLLQQFERYFEANDVSKGGSFYLQSKIYRAKELLTEFQDEKRREEQQQQQQQQPQQNGNDKQ